MFTIFLAGDSTVQSYRSEARPVTGWGQMLHRYFQETSPRVNESGCDWMGCGHASRSKFGQSVCYETDGFFIDNRAAAARSSRSFLDEGRLSDIEASMKPGDYLFMQFAHNDANTEKPGRYVTPEQYAGCLLRYVDVCRRCGAQPVFVTAIPMREFDEAAGQCRISFPHYRDKMIEIGDKCGIPVLDLGKTAADFLTGFGKERAKELFMWIKPGEYPDGPYKNGKEDNAHLKDTGADIFAGLLAGLIRDYSQCNEMDRIKKWLRCSGGKI